MTSIHARLASRVTALLAVALLGALPALTAASQEAAPPITVSGFIEADQVAIASEIGGRISALPAAEGAEVRSGDLLAQLDTTMTEAELGIARARLAAARAALARVKAGTRAEVIAQAEAALAQAEAARDAAKQSWEDAELLARQQQTLDLQIVQATWQVEVSRKRLDAAVASLEAVQVLNDRFTQPLEDYRIWQAWTTVNAAGAAYDGAVALLAKLQAERASPVAQRARANAARAAHEAAQAGVGQAQARLADARAGATREQIAVAQAQARVAEADARSVETRLAKLTLRAPVDGMVLSRELHAGEIAGPGAAILTLSSLDPVRLVVYVPAGRLGLVTLGQEVPVSVDGAPGRIFTGTVTRIADRAEFAPSNVQAAEERVAQVYAVQIRLANADRALKPGVPADATLAGER